MTDRDDVWASLERITRRVEKLEETVHGVAPVVTPTTGATGAKREVDAEWFGEMRGKSLDLARAVQNALDPHCILKPLPEKLSAIAERVEELCTHEPEPSVDVVGIRGGLGCGHLKRPLVCRGCCDALGQSYMRGTRG